MIRPGRKKINIEWLPPTYAAQLHAERAYLQVKDWGGNSLNPESSGWHMVDGILEPIPMMNRHHLSSLWSGSVGTNLTTLTCSSIIA